MCTGFYIINVDAYDDGKDVNKKSKFDINFEVLERSEGHMRDEGYGYPRVVLCKDKEQKKDDEIVCDIVLKACAVEFFKYENFFNAIIEFSKKNPDFMISITERERDNLFEINNLTTDEVETVLRFSIDKHQSFNNMFKVIHKHLFNNE